MQHLRTILPLIALTAVVTAATAEASPEAACSRLREVLEQQLAALEPIADAASAEAAVPKLEAVLQAFAAMDASPAAQKELWEYIDNTEGVKQPLIELLQCIAMEFTRLEKAAFFGHAGLRDLLAPQLIPSETEEELTAPAAL